MWWRLTRAQFNEQRGEGNRRAMKKIVDSGEIPGIIAYSDGQPAAWCSVAPRENYSALERSRTLKQVDEEPVWSVVCFFVAKPFRGRGVTVPLLRGAVEYAKRNGAKILEGYPVDTEKRMPPSFVWTGVASMFLKAGFVEVLRRSKTQPIMRYFVREH
jgi:GNAT superfamily N-acetyltransferase